MGKRRIVLLHRIRLGGARSTCGRTREATTGAVPDPKALRAWAAPNGIELSTRGRIPGTVLDQYRAAGN